MRKQQKLRIENLEDIMSKVEIVGYALRITVQYTEYKYIGSCGRRRSDSIYFN